MVLNVRGANTALLLFILVTSAANKSCAQTNKFPPDGSVGIGTLYPRSALDVAKYISGETLGAIFGRLSEGDGEGSGTFVGVKGYGTSTVDGKSFSIIHNFYGLTNSSINFFRGGDRTGGFISFATGTNVERLRIDNNGNVGIGTSSPARNLDVNGSVFIRGTGTYKYNNPGVGDLQIGYALATPNTPGSVTRLAIQPYGHTAGPWKFDARDISGAAFLDIYYGGNGVGSGITMGSDGNVGIGTTMPDSKLSVNGVIHAQAVNVNLIGWPDYVFAPTYKLVPLDTLKSYIKLNQHLPDIPSAVDIERDGVNVGEMLKSQLKKIEELTLYLIELKGENKKLMNRVAEMEKRK